MITVLLLWSLGSVPQPAEPSAVQGESGPITLVIGVDLSYGGVRAQLIHKWNKIHPDNPVRVVELSSSTDLQHAQMLAAEQAGERGYDVLHLDLTWTAEFAENHAIRPLDPGVLTAGGAPDDFLKTSLDSAYYTPEGSTQRQLWAVPYTTDAGLLFYRADLLKKSGLSPPTTWEEMKRAAQIVRDRQINTSPNRQSSLEAAYVTQLDRYEGLTVNTLEITSGVGEDLRTLSGKSEGIEQLAGFLGGSTDQVILPESKNSDETASLESFIAGKVLFMRNWPYAYNLLAAELPDGAVGVTQLPSVDGDHSARPVLGGWNLAVAAHSTKPRLAQQLIEFLTAPGHQQCLLERGGLAATRAGAYDRTSAVTCDLDPVTGQPDFPEGADTPTLYQNNEALTALETALRNAQLRPTTPYYPQVTEVIQTTVSDVLDQMLRNEDYNKTLSALPEKLREAQRGR
ncbi:MAG: extracellular solute-binding protein [Pseudonocardiaceae bacterium]